MTSTSSTSIVESPLDWVNATGSGTLLDLFPQRLLAMGFSQLGRLGIGGIIALNMSAMPAMGTSPLVLDYRHFPKCVAPAPSASAVNLRPTSEQLQIISHVLNLSKSELARAMRITRPPLYDWLKGKSVPKDENARRLSTIANLVEEVTPDDARPLFSLFVTEPIEEGVPSIMECLQQEDLDQALLGRLLVSAREHTTQRDLRLAEFERESRLEPQALALREARLDLNLTHAEWNKG